MLIVLNTEGVIPNFHINSQIIKLRLNEFLMKFKILNPTPQNGIDISLYARNNRGQLSFKKWKLLIERESLYKKTSCQKLELVYGSFNI